MNKLETTLLSEHLEREREYWLQKLSGELALTGLPLDFERPPLFDERQERVEITINQQTLDQLFKASDRTPSLIFAILVAALKVSLYKYTGEEDIIVGSSIHEQHGEDASLNQVLALRDRVSGTATVRQLLADVKQTLSEAYAHQKYPFGRLLDLLGFNPAVNQESLFNVVILLENIHDADKVRQLKNDLTFSFCISDEGLAGILEYRSGLFNRTTVEQFARHYAQVLRSMLDLPDTQISKLRMLSEAETEELLRGGNETGSDYPREGTVAGLFEEQVKERAEATAVVFGAERVSYEELNERANRLARHLRSLGVGREELVGICVERSTEMVVSLLGILKAGGAYLPLDAGNPGERLASIMSEGQVRVLLVQEKFKELFAAESGVRVVSVDSDWGAVAQYPAENLEEVGVEAEQLAYAMFTSGSTGVPNGVCVTQRSVVRLVKETNYVELGEEEVLLQLAPLSFDASTFEIWGCLLNGGRLVVMPPGAPTLEELGAALKEHGVTTLWLTAGLFHLMVEQGLGDLSGLRQLLAGGDVLSVSHVKKFLERAGSTKLINGYGPTENTTFTCCHVMAAGDDLKQTVPIGRPIANTRVYLLDEQLEPVPMGVNGELYISGDGLARCYLKRPELTAEKFIPDPFSRSGGERLYRSGDTARYRPDGVLEFVGRRDNQVKVRGFRIELGEIEAALGSHAEVGDAVVIARAGKSGGEKQVVAYVVLRGERLEGLTGELRSYLRSKLPEYMVPAAFVMMAQLPLTANGKIDRRALPEPAAENTEAAATYVGPRNEMEELVAGVWQQVLGLERVGIYDNFFDLGGHSLLATQVITRLRDALKVQIPLVLIFENSTVAGLAAALEAEVRAGHGVIVPPVAHVPHNGAVPLSFAQQRLWFLDRLMPDAFSYNTPLAYRITGPLDVKALNKSINQIVARHEVLRTTITLVEGEPAQIIAPEVSLQLQVSDLELAQGSDCEEALQREVEREAQLPFDLSAGPVIRARLLRIAPNDHLLVVTLHHIVADGWSIGVFARDLSAFYRAVIKGQEAALPPLPVQYADYAAWQRDWLKGDELERQLRYWREQLQGAPTVLELPGDRPRPKLASGRGALERFEVSGAVLAGLKSVARQEGATLFMTLLAAFAALLSRYSGQKDLLIGAPIANRNREELEGLIGFFANTLVLRARVDDEVTFRGLVQRARETCLGAYAHQDVPFEALVEELQPERDLSRSPLFQVVLTVQNAPMKPLELSGLTLSRSQVHTDTAKFDLGLNIYEKDSSLSAGFEYNRDVFEPETIRGLIGRFEILLEGIVERPEGAVAELPLVSKAQLEYLVKEWNETGVEYPLSRCLHELIEEQAERQPGAVALEWGGRELSYGELNERANRLARQLRRRGIGAGSQVGVMLRHSFEMVIGVLGVMKAGAAYVPLEPEHPRLRQELTLEDARAALLLTEAGLVAELPRTEVPVIVLEEEWEEIEKEEGSNLELGGGSESLAYVIYTSGSTGRPKGVKITHRSLVNYVSWAAEQYLGDGAASMALYSSLAFDLTVTSLYAPLVSGGRAIIYEQRGRETAVLRVFEEGLAAVVKLTPSHLGLVAGMDHGSSGIRRLVVGGEALETGLARRTWESFGGRVEIVNEYGPTEATVGCMIHRYDAERDRRVQVPIGRPAANAHIYVVDERGEEVGEGIAGELLVSGEGVAAGYYNRRELSAERFGEDRYRAGVRSYRTGDVARRLSGGDLEYLGRRDEQVKVRGHRVELSELRAAVNAHAEIRDSVVVLRSRKVGEVEVPELVCYYVGRREVSEAELREHLQERVVAETIPGRFVRIGKVPLTLNGKVNEEGLPEPWGVETTAATTSGARELTETEQVLAGVWSQVLGVSQVGAGDNFFSLGGHSLLATLIVIRIHETFGVEIPLRAIFEKPTIAGLAEEIEAVAQTEAAARKSEEEESDLRRIPRIPRDAPLPLSFAQQRLWFLARLMPEALSYNAPVAYRIVGPLEVKALEKSLNQIVARHEVLRTTISLVAGEPAQIIASELRFTVELTDLRSVPGAERDETVRREVDREAQLPFDLSTGPVIRARLLQVADDEHVLVVTLHHIVADGWSMGVFTENLSDLYAAAVTGQEATLPQLPVQYADYAAWQREWLEGEELERQLAYWSEQLAGAPTVLELPTDRPRPKMLSSRGSLERFDVSAEVCSKLRELSQEEGATLFMTLLAAFATLLSRYSGQKDLLIGAPIANRNREELEGLIGFFANTLVLRASMHAEATFREFARQMKEVCLGAYAHQDVPFEKLVEELQPERDLTRSPLFQVVFSLQNAPSSPPEMPDLTVTEIRADTNTAKFDLGLNLFERADGSLFGAFEYNVDLFDVETIRGLIGRFEILLEGIVERPEGAVAELPLVSKAQLEYLVKEWNETGVEYPLSRCLHELIEEQAERQPGAVALEWGGRELSYGELNERANRLARQLRRRGIGAGSQVGVMLRHSFEMVIGVLGVMKAGAAYVPLEPEHPRLRQELTLEDARAALLLTEAGLVAELPRTEVPVIVLEEEWEEIEKEEGSNLELGGGSESLAYVIYTSGSTGRPKGVKITHRSLVNYVSWAAEQYLGDGAASMALYSSLAFDLTVTSLYAPLVSGGRAIIYEQRGRETAVLRVFEEGLAAVVKLTPSHLGLVAGMDHGSSGIRRLVVGGEALETGLARRTWESFGGRVEIVNEYGPTEATVGCMIHRYDAERDRRVQVPIGRPAANAHIYVVDERGEEVGEGIAGELLVSGEGVAAGYYNRRELSAERFGEDRYRAGVRSYRTGDVARRLSGGDLEYLGRRDEQVKVRGHRVELSELRAAVNAHAEIRDSVVVLRSRKVGEVEVPELVCYYVGRREVSEAELREHLQERVVAETIPGRFVRIGKVPLTLNGKVNEEGLPEPWGVETTAATTSGARELTETEQVLAGVWSQVLGVSQVGAGDNFFSLGGHSLLATLIVIRIHETFGVEIPLRKIFEAPTVVELAAVVEAAVRAGHGLISPPITSAPRLGSLPLSFAQQRLWFLDRLTPGTAAYNVPVAYHLAGSVDAAALERSINQIVARHEVLRTTISLIAGEPAQMIAPELRLTLEVSDLRSGLAAEREATVRRAVDREARLPFDLSTGPVIRARLLRVAGDEHVLVVTLHHIVSDGWSMDVFGRELSALYEAEVRGERECLPELPVQYADFAVWQREWLQGEVLEEQLSYWRGQLQGATGVLEMPTDRTRPKVAGGPGAIERFEIAEEVLAGLRRLALDEGATLFMTLWAGFSVLLSRYTGQQDLLVGAPVANRGKPEVEGLIGFFSNTLVLRAQVAGEETFRTLVDRAREVCLGAYAHQDLPFEALVEELQPDRDVSRSPLFQVTFAVQSPAGKALELSGLKTTPLAVDTLTSKFELTVVLGEKDGRLLGAIQYNTDLFDAETVARLASHFVVLLEHVVENPDTSVSSLPILTRVETERALVHWNQTEAEYQTQKCAHHLFEEQVARTPHALALVWGDQRLSYSELNRRADQLARYLRKQGVGAEKFVGVCLERSAESAVSILGVLKSGGACLLLDPTAAKDELATSLEEVRPQLLLVQERLARYLPEWRGRLLCVDSQWTDVEHEVRGDTNSKVAPESLAYLLCSRGLDGNFRAVAHTHAALGNGLHWMQHAFRLSELDRVLHKASVGSEVGLWELLSPLLVGATLVIAEPREETNCAYLARLVREHDVSTAHFAPSLLENFVDEFEVSGSLRRVLCSGEPLSRGLRERFEERLRAELHYLYAPKELAVGAAHWACGRDDGGGVAPAGRPIANTQMYVLDASMQPVPVGVEGNLYIGGAGVARGYLNSPDATAERLIPDPFGGQAGSRLFKTDEFCRYRADGAIEHSGRTGRRVKVKGYELELLDVEAQLRLCPGVLRAVVVPTDHGYKGKRLIAYIVPVPGFASGDALINAVRTFLRERLPDYALPSTYITLAALPLRSDGRLDRGALPEPEVGRPETESAFVPPATETEHKIAAAWQEYLGIEGVGLNDNFFDLGGHSLLLAQLHIKLSELFGDALSVIDLFRYPTVSALAQYLNERQPAGTSLSSAAALPEGPLAVRVGAEPLRTVTDVPANAIAIIGMAARLPGCRDIAEFWQKLKDGVELISFFSDEDLAKAGVNPEMSNDPNYVKASAFLDEPDHFDAAFFGIHAREAEAMDPQQRQFLECAWAALEDAGYDSEQFDGRIGVYAGVGMNTYLPNVYSNPEVMRTLGAFQVMLGNDKDFLPTRVSYKLNLRGPSVAVQTACSTSLVAVHLASQSLLDGECDIALCGGVTIRGTKAGYIYQEGGITSPDGHCRAFDSGAAGTVPGNGVGIVVLKRLCDALADGDRVEAVILGSAINNDGSLKIGFTAPSIEGQAEVIAQAQSKAGVTPETITYVEAHGTGTDLGDPIEVAALTQAFGLSTSKKGYCALGSVKTNVGHLDAAAGVCGLIKTALALKHKQLPPSLHYQAANPKIDFPDTPFYVNTKLRDWETNGAPRRAGVSSFGIGGTNAHVVLEEAPERQPVPAAPEPQLLLLSARTQSALETATANLRGHLQNHPGLELRDVAYTLQAGRRSFEHRRVLVAHDCRDAVEALERLDARLVVTATQKLRQRPCVFVFPGQGAQYVNMGAGLYESVPTFRKHVDQCCELLMRYTGADLREILYPRAAASEEAARLIDQTVNAQPALFVIEYALTQLFAELGVTPKAMLGHSVGEYVAACVSGVFSLKDALMLVARRAELMQSLPVGRMLVVPLPEREVEPMLRGGLSLAAVNADRMCVVSGPTEAVAELEAELSGQGVEGQPLHTSHAFHSAMVEPIIKPFVDLVKEVQLKAPRIPYVSNLTGAWTTVSQAVDPNYWGDHLRRTVRFADGVKQLLADRRVVITEMGPGTGLSGLIKKHSARVESQDVLSPMRHPKDRRGDLEFLLQTLGAAWLAGVSINWPALHSGEHPRRVQLPTYPFERKRYWIERPTARASQLLQPADPGGNGDHTSAEPVAAAHVNAATLPVKQVDSTQSVVTHGNGAPHDHGYWEAPTPTQQIIARQLEISSQQVRLMALQLDLVRNVKLRG